MVKDDWRLIALLGLGFAALVGGGLGGTFLTVSAYRHEHVAQRDDAGSADQPEAQKKAQLSCPAGPAPEREQCIDKEVEAAQSEKRDQYDVRAQQEMAQYALGVLMISALGFVVSSAGLVALFYTFNEQRKLTRSEARAYMTIGRGEVGINGTYGLHYRLWFKNNGNTPAERVSFDGQVVITEQKEDGPRGEAVRTTTPIGFALDEVPSKAVAFGNCWAHDILDLPEGLKVSQGSHYRRMGSLIGTGDPEEDGVDERIAIVGKFTYFDVFGQKHVIDIDQWSHSLADDGWLRGTGAMENLQESS